MGMVVDGLGSVGVYMYGMGLSGGREGKVGVRLVGFGVVVEVEFYEIMIKVVNL